MFLEADGFEREDAVGHVPFRNHSIWPEHSSCLTLGDRSDEGAGAEGSGAWRLPPDCPHPG